MSSIPARDLVKTTPSVIGVGGSALQLVAMMLSSSTRIPTGTVQSFASAAAVQSYFGPGTEATLASIYFAGFDGSTKKPANLLMAQFNTAAVSAFLRGGELSLTLAQLQAVSGSLDVVVDGYPRDAGSVNLSSATSFSNAASIIQTALNSADPTEASVTAQIGSTFTGTQSGTTLTVASISGTISLGDAISGTGVASGTVITAFVSGTGGNGTYTTNKSGTASSASCTGSSNVLDVTAVGSGTVAAGQYVTGVGVSSAVILSQIGGTPGGVGTYQIAGSPQQVASESMTIEGTPVAVAYDSVSGGFIITSGITGTGSSMAFATGSIAATLMLTSATGAVLSQGAAAVTSSTVGALLDSLVAITQNFVNVMTTFDPDAGSGFAFKEAIAAWKNAALGGDRFGYVCWDPDLAPSESSPASGTLGAALEAIEDSGTCLIGQDATAQAAGGLILPSAAVFVCGACASIDTTAANGRITFAYKAQAGLTATVSSETAANNLAGSPQSAAQGNGYNFYGAYAEIANFTWFQRGFVTGPFTWFDSYVDQIWWNANARDALLALLGSVTSIPYSSAGNSLIEGALSSIINKGLSFGMYGPGPLSGSEAAAVNNLAGADVASTIQTQGFYLQIKPSDPTTRAARTSPPMTFFYLDQGSVQAIDLASVAAQ